jgi:hypothetical protein
MDKAVSLRKSIVDSTGILYVATGKKYIKAAMHSAKTVKKFCPELPTHLFADYQDYQLNFEQSSSPFTTIKVVENPHRRSKLDYLALTPYDRTLYLDTDTALNADISEVFQILDRFDVALCHAHRRNQPVRTRIWREDIPIAFPQFNSGVFLYKKSPEVIRFLETWASSFREAGFPQDQTTLRELIWLSDLRIATLPPEYNVRFMKYHHLWSQSEATTKIFHLRRFHDGRLWFVMRGVKKLLRPLFRR